MIARQTESMEKAIDMMIESLYNLREDEIKVVEGEG
jgi:hypothetical protein